MEILPEAFVASMKNQLPADELAAFLSAYEAPAQRGLSLAPEKITADALSALLDLSLTPVPWAVNGYYYEDPGRPGKHPLHEAGAYYIQEPSAMLPTVLLDASPNEVVLDLCAAPGGKTTQLASQMKHTGLLVANEIHPARAKILSGNVERLGCKNVIVLNETPDRLAERFPAFFDKILVDAPCSGEGMFRKDPAAIAEWSAESPALCAARQEKILDAASHMLRSGGRIVYSTCTFAPEEDEELIDRFLSAHPAFTLTRTEKLYPHRVRGEGQFAAVLTHTGGAVPAPRRRTEDALARGKQRLQVPEELSALLTAPLPAARLTTFGDQLYLLPEIFLPLDRLKVLRAGLHLGSFAGKQKDRFIPAYALSHTLTASDVKNSLALSLEAARSYIAGNPVPADGKSGFLLLTVEGLGLSFGKAGAGVVKNHYPKGLRRNL